MFSSFHRLATPVIYTGLVIRFIWFYMQAKPPSSDLIGLHRELRLRQSSQEQQEATAPEKEEFTLEEEEEQEGEEEEKQCRRTIHSSIGPSVGSPPLLRPAEAELPPVNRFCRGSTWHMNEHVVAIELHKLSVIGADEVSARSKWGAKWWLRFMCRCALLALGSSHSLRLLLLLFICVM